MQAVAASALGLDRLVETWNAAYAGYFVPLSWDVAQLERHVAMGSVDLDRSLVWLDGSDPMALSLLGVRPDTVYPASSAHSTGGIDQFTSSVQNLPGQTTSSVQNLPGDRGWIGGFGIAPSHRGRGLSTDLMEEQLDMARSRGLRRVQLEVLTQNWAAKSYERAGFATTRRLAVLQGALDPDATERRVLPPARWLAPGDVPDLAAQLHRLHAAYPAAWTREPTSALGMPDGLGCLTVGSADDLEAVALVREDGAGVQVVDAVARDEPAARALVAGLASGNPGRPCRVVNEPDGSPLVAAFESAGLTEVLAQYEMHWSA